ncbi:hypothetical protein BKA81DRAFT_59286 [Phyllosticta paracitricarpa]|uniref:Uncharacterized protein n=1 Tax=Phyllosticta paracitricarpa TaxID=2016321 RepID=A0ABR1NFD0_9PEZI
MDCRKEAFPYPSQAQASRGFNQVFGIVELWERTSPSHSRPSLLKPHLTARFETMKHWARCLIERGYLQIPHHVDQNHLSVRLDAQRPTASKKSAGGSLRDACLSGTLLCSSPNVNSFHSWLWRQRGSPWQETQHLRPPEQIAISKRGEGLAHMFHLNVFLTQTNPKQSHPRIFPSTVRCILVWMHRALHDMHSRHVLRHTIMQKAMANSINGFAIDWKSCVVRSVRLVPSPYSNRTMTSEPSISSGRHA